MHRIVLLCALATGVFSWLAPNHYLPWVAFHAEAAMAVALALAAFASMGDRVGRDHVTSTLLVAFVLSVVPLMQLASGITLYRGDAWLATLYLLGFALSQIVGQRLVRRYSLEQVTTDFALAVIAACVISVGIAMYQWLGLKGLGAFAVEMPPNGRPFANVAQPNHLATMLGLGSLSTLYLYERRVLSGGSAALVALYFGAGMAMTSSRTAWLSVALSGLCLLALRRRVLLRVSRRTISSCVLGFGLMVIGWPAVNDTLLLSPGRTFNSQAEVGPRRLVWETALDAISREPLVGYGWNQILVAQSRVVEQHPAGGRLLDSSHNLLLDLMLWNGIPLGLALIAVGCAWIAFQFAAVRTPAHAFALVCISVILVHSMVEYPLSYAYFLLPFGVFVGCVDTTRDSARPMQWPSWMCNAGIVLVTGLATIVMTDYLNIEEATRRLRFQIAGIDVGAQPVVLEESLLLSQWEAYIRSATNQPSRSTSASDLLELERVATRFPYSPMQLNVAIAFALKGQQAESSRWLRRLCALHGAMRCEQMQREWRRLQIEFPEMSDVALPKP